MTKHTNVFSLDLVYFGTTKCFGGVSQGHGLEMLTDRCGGVFEVRETMFKMFPKQLAHRVLHRLKEPIFYSVAPVASRDLPSSERFSGPKIGGPIVVSCGPPSDSLKPRCLGSLAARV